MRMLAVGSVHAIFPKPEEMFSKDAGHTEIAEYNRRYQKTQQNFTFEMIKKRLFDKSDKLEYMIFW